MAGRVMRGSQADPFLGYEVAGLLDGPLPFARSRGSYASRHELLKTVLQLLAD
jgi:hypothetical protein